jgi:hypothetical protein
MWLTYAISRYNIVTKPGRLIGKSVHRHVRLATGQIRHWCIPGAVELRLDVHLTLQKVYLGSVAGFQTNISIESNPK